MAQKKRPAEFPTDWHWEAHLEALKRELAGCEARISELKAMPENAAGRDESLALIEGERDATLAQMKHYGIGQENAAKRPKAAAKKEKRA